MRVELAATGRVGSHTRETSGRKPWRFLWAHQSAASGEAQCALQGDGAEGQESWV